MRIASTISDSIVDGPGLRFTVFTQGCAHACPGCHNPETHDIAGGHEERVETLAELMGSNPLTGGLTLSGLSLIHIFPRRWRHGRIDYAMAGQNLFQINVREKKGPAIKQ